MDGLLDSAVVQMVAEWTTMFVTAGVLIYLVNESRKGQVKISWLLEAGLSLLLLRAGLDIIEDHPSFFDVPIIGRGDPLNRLYMNSFAGLAGLVLLSAGAWWDTVRNWRIMRTLDRENQLHMSVLQNLDTGVVVWDENERVVFANPAAAQALETRIELSRGEPMLPLPSHRGVVVDPETGGPVYMVREKVLRRPEDEGSLLVRTLWDVTPWKETQRQSQELVSAVSHELRNPLTSIAGFLDLALDDPSLAPDTREQLQIARSSSDRLKAMVEDLLQLSRIDAGVIKYELEPCPLADLLAETLEEVSASFASKRISVLTPVPGEPIWAMADPRRLVQVMANLLTNAFKYTPPGGSITVRLTRQGDRVGLDVEDTGIGIPREEQHRVFSRFYRSEAAKALSGTGLGLAITKALVEGMGGTISFVSQPGSGTTFSIRLAAGAEELVLDEEPRSVAGGLGALAGRPRTAPQPV